MKRKLPRIAATLKYGPCWPPILVVLIQILFYCGIGIFVFSSVIFFSGLLGAIDDGMDAWIGMVASVLFIVPSMSFMIFLAVRNRKIRLWLEDAVPLTAQSMTVAVKELMGRGGFTYRHIKISLKFFYNGEKYIRVSGNPEKHNELNGFSTRYWDYTDREIKILYSPTYDQVMILWEDKLRSK